MDKKMLQRATVKTDAISMLKADHAAVKDLFKQFNALAEASAPAHQKKRTIALKICKELTVHAKVEEEIFYPAARAVLGRDEAPMMDEADVEHASCKELIGQIESMEPSENHYDAKVIVLGEYINHHVKEEEGEMFPKVRNAKLDLKGLGEHLVVRKKELMSSYSPEKASLLSRVLG
jgi:hemerythrin superfamily protein